MTDPFNIRDATAADVDEIVRLETQITGLSHSREREILGAAVSSHDCLVSTDGAESGIGYIVLTRKAFFGRDFVRLLGVADGHRRLGVATALPSSLDRIARWSAGLEARGVELVPVSALSARPPGAAPRPPRLQLCAPG